MKALLSFLRLHNISLYVYTSSLYFQKFALRNFFSVFVNWKTSKEDFCFYETKQNVKISSSTCFAWALVEAPEPSGCERPRPAPSREPLSVSASVPGAVNCVWEHLCSILIYFVHSYFYLSVMLDVPGSSYIQSLLSSNTHFLTTLLGYARQFTHLMCVIQWF